MARTLLLVASLVTALGLAPLAEARLAIIPPIEDIPNAVFHYAGQTVVVDGPCPTAEACVPDYCIPPGGPCNPIPDILNILP